MKRWQDRGEVLDSDEEDWSLEEEPPPLKRARLEDGEKSTRDGDQEEVELRLVRAEQTPARAAKHAEQPGNDATSPSNSVSQIRRITGDEEAPAAVGTDDKEPTWSEGIPAITYARWGKLPKRKITQARELVPVIARSEQYETIFGETSKAANSASNGPQQSSAQGLAEEPAAAELDDDHTHKHQSPRPTTEPLDFGDTLSRASTPLSDPPESPQAPSPAGTTALYNENHNRDARHPTRSTSVNSDLTIHPGTIENLLLQGPGGRSLRRRNEKQLHPYLYEAAVYRRQCRERGIRPVKAIVDQIMHKTPAAQRQDGDTEHQSGSSRAPTSSSPASSGSADVDNSAPERSSALHLSAPGSDEDLPDLDTLIRRGQIEAQRFGTKRRKLAHPASRIRVSSLVRGETDAQRDDFSVPPSPPDSSYGSASGTQPLKRPTGFRLPRGMSPLPLPTPQISSDTRPSHIGSMAPEGDDESDSSLPETVARSVTRRHPVIEISEESSSEESASASNHEESQLQQQRRRIRGVLPASWLRMDQKAQTRSKPSKDRTPDSPVRPGSTQRGVARRLPARRVPSQSRVPLMFSDDETSQNSDVHLRNPDRHATAKPRDPDVFIAATRDDDVMEVDFIDPMLGGSSRQKKDGTFRKRQPRIDDALGGVRNGYNDFSEERNAFRKMRGARQEQTGPRKRKKAARQVKRTSYVQLGILDAPSSPAAVTAAQPQFVRLATRRARQSANRARGSPSHKVIRLATHGDTEDANATLRAWRQGKLTQRSDHHRRRNVASGTQSNSRQQERSMSDRAAAAVDGQQMTTERTSAVQFPIDRARSLTNSTSAPGDPQALADQPSGYMQHTIHPLRPRDEAARRPKVHYRGAQLESLAYGQDHADRTSVFRHRVQCLTEAVSRRAKTRAQPSLPMTRVVQARSPTYLPEEPRDRVQADLVPQYASEPRKSTARGPAPAHRPRKRPPTRIDVEIREFRQPSEPLPDISHVVDVGDEPAPTQSTLRGLGVLGTRYSTDFDIRPLPQGTFFHQSTFIGSGDLAAALQLGTRDLDAGAGSLRIYINGTMHEWAAWTEEVSSAVAVIPNAIASLLRGQASASSSQQAEQFVTVVSNVDHMLRSLARYLSKCVRFYDPIDRKGCAQSIKDMVESILDLDSDEALWSDQIQSLRQRVLQYAVVLARQCRTLCHSSLVPMPYRSASDETTRLAATRLGAVLVSRGLDELRSIYELCRSTAVSEGGLREDDSVLAGILILSHCLPTGPGQSPSFWAAVRSNLPVAAPSANVVHLEEQWYALFTLLPGLDFDASGLIGSRQNSQPLHCDWSMPRQLLESCLELYQMTSAVPGSSINDYIRTLLVRCYKLVATWRWWPCETVLGIIYDFFARRGLCLLNHEEGRGSPAFLEDSSLAALDHSEISAGDHSFHIFLKLLAFALIGMHKHQVYTDKKVSGIIWRFIPNHARMYRRDAEVKQTDLHALRNHCDLLCTLYIASPPACRLRLDLLRNLVDHSTSHREACRISVRAWAHVASFQMSTDEALQMLNIPAQWFREMLQTTVNQYRLARTEAELEYGRAKAEGTLGMTDELLERTIAGNQRQIAATLVDLIAALKRAVTFASTLSAASYLLEHTDPWQVVWSFSLTERRLHPLFHEVLDLVTRLREVQKRLISSSDSQTASDDSQEYGDLEVFEEFAATRCAPTPAPNLTVLMLEPVSQVLSNTFGAELSPGDDLLHKIVNVWIDLASELVRRGLRTWTNFVDDYSVGAWFQLRDTEQRHAYTPYVLSRIVESDYDAPNQLRDVLFATWLRSLVERESRLKYQHVLTAALMEACVDEPMLRNLHFSKASASHAYHITLQELRERRLALLSSVLSNMRESFDDMLYHRPQALPALKRRYGDYLRQLMQAMKANYQDVQADGDQAVAEAGVSGAYVGFVQQVVSFLQQYTTDICAIDKFFVDSSAFPLPATDPTYVVGKLRSYVPRLAESKSRKQLAVFVHTVSERAAVDAQQPYLINQFVAAMSGVLELGNERAPSLRHVLLTAVFPAYIEGALSTACSWILAAPILEASARTLADLLYDMALDRTESVTAAVQQIEATLRSVQRAMAPTLVHLGPLSLPHVHRTLSAMFSLCKTSLTVSCHLARASSQAKSLRSPLAAMRTYARAIEAQLSGAEKSALFEPPADPTASGDDVWPDTSAFSRKQLQDSLTNNWHANDGRFFLRQGNSSTEVMAPLMEDGEERQRLLEAISDFRNGLDRQKHRKRRIGRPRVTGIA